MLVVDWAGSFKLKLCAAAVLARQLLEAGAHVCEPEDNLFLQPLHIACIGHLSSSDEVRTPKCVDTFCTAAAGCAALRLPGVDAVFGKVMPAVDIL
jgi:hypothetical protein